MSVEIIKFIFSNFWIWLGFVVLACCVLKYMVDLVNAIRAKRKVRVYKADDRWQVLVENASCEDVEAALIRQELRENLDEQMRAKEAKSDET